MAVIKKILVRAKIAYDTMMMGEQKALWAALEAASAEFKETTEIYESAITATMNAARGDVNDEPGSESPALLEAIRTENVAKEEMNQAREIVELVMQNFRGNYHLFLTRPNPDPLSKEELDKMVEERVKKRMKLTCKK